jgi:selenocysteine-specific elongation factor
VAGPVAEGLTQRLLAAVDRHHAAAPLSAGLNREAVRGALPPVADPRLFARLLQRQVEAGALALAGELVRRPGHVAAAAGGAGGAAKAKVAAVLRQGGLTPPSLAELPAAAGVAAAEVAAVLKLMLADGSAVRVSTELYYDGAVVAALRGRLVALLEAQPSITTGEFKALVGATRKHVIPLAEYFDRENVTLRVGETRVLRRGAR